MRSDKRDKSLSIDATTYLYHCHYCQASGVLRSKMGEILSKDQRNFQPKKKTYSRPTKKINADKKYSESFLSWFQGRCISEDTLRKAKVTQETEVMPNVGKTGVVAFNYYLNGELVNIKFRTREKGFKMVSGAQVIPYNLDSIENKAFKEGEEKHCFITEGEMDTLTLIECGYGHAISAPAGGGNTNLEFLDDFIDSHFDQLDYIYICVDNDSVGMSFRRELIRRFGEDRCRIIDYPAPCKDINEVLMKYGKDAVKKCVENYTELRPDGIQELVDVESSLDDIFHNGLQKGATVGIPSVDKIVSFKTGMLNVVTGVPSHGKTYLLNYLLVKLNLMQDWKIAFFSPEFYPVSLHISQVIETMGGQRFSAQNYNYKTYEVMKSYMCKNFFFIDPNDTDINSVMDRAKYLIRKKGIKALVIDPFNALTDKERKNVKQDEYISEFLQKLRWFARKFDVAIFLVMHPTKMNKMENGLYPICDLYNCKGASEIFDKADMGLTVWRNELEDYAELHVTKIKFRHLGEKGKATFKFNTRNGRYVEIDSAEDVKLKGLDMRTIPVDWDNNNYILQKIQGENKQSEFGIDDSIKTQAMLKPNTAFAPAVEADPLPWENNSGYYEDDETPF
jgi:twinkle protein